MTKALMPILLGSRPIDCLTVSMLGICAPIHDDLVQFDRIGKDRSRFFIDVGLDFDRRRYGGLQEFHGFLGNQRHPDGHALFIGLAAECQNLFYKIFGPIGRFQGLIEFGLAVLCAFIEHGQFGIADDFGINFKYYLGQ